MITGDIDTTYQTQQRDMFASGLAAQIGVNALGVWLAIKSHADFQTGEARPGVRRLMKLTGLASKTTQNAIAKLKAAHLLRVVRWKGQSPVYVARERLDVRVGERVLCTIVVDYVPVSMRKRLQMLKAASEGDAGAQDVWRQVEILPGPDLEWDANTQRLRGAIQAGEVQVTGVAAAVVQSDARKRTLELVESMRRQAASRRISG